MRASAWSRLGRLFLTYLLLYVLLPNFLLVENICFLLHNINHLTYTNTACGYKSADTQSTRCFFLYPAKKNGIGRQNRVVYTMIM